MLSFGASSSSVVGFPLMISSGFVRSSLSEGFQTNTAVARLLVEYQILLAATRSGSIPRTQDLGNHPKPAIDNHFKTGHREAA